MQRWFVAMVNEPGRPLVEVTFRRPWYFLGLWPSVAARALVPEGADWALAVSLSLDVSMVREPGSGKFHEPPHTRSARRVALALSTLSARLPLVGYRADAVPPLPRPGPPPASDAQRELLAILGYALSHADAAPGGAGVDTFMWEMKIQRARDLDELVALVRSLAEEARTRPRLRLALDEVHAKLAQPWAAGTFGERLREALEAKP